MLQRKPKIFNNLNKFQQVLKAFILLSLLGISSIYLSKYRNELQPTPPHQSEFSNFTNLADIKHAYENQLSNLQIKQYGLVKKILRDDEHTPRHQRFVVQLASGQNLLVAHNIELAPRVKTLAEGTKIIFYGEYEWNNKGGVVHWTHRDPNVSHPDGWLIYDGKKYN